MGPVAPRRNQETDRPRTYWLLFCAPPSRAPDRLDHLDFLCRPLETGKEAAAKNDRSSGTFGDGAVVRAAGTVRTEIGDPPG